MHILNISNFTNTFLSYLKGDKIKIMLKTVLQSFRDKQKGRKTPSATASSVCKINRFPTTTFAIITGQEKRQKKTNNFSQCKPCRK